MNILRVFELFSPITGREIQIVDIWESFSFFLISVVITWTAVVLPVALMTQGFIGTPDHTINKRKK